jgi:hypothetical protein
MENGHILDENGHILVRSSSSSSIIKHIATIKETGRK